MFKRMYLDGNRSQPGLPFIAHLTSVIVSKYIRRPSCAYCLHTAPPPLGHACDGENSKSWYILLIPIVDIPLTPLYQFKQQFSVTTSQKLASCDTTMCRIFLIYDHTFFCKTKGASSLLHRLRFRYSSIWHPNHLLGHSLLASDNLLTLCTGELHLKTSAHRHLYNTFSGRGLL